MSSWRAGAKQRSVWHRTGPTARLAVGLIAIGLVGLFGLTEKSLFGISAPWPHAALWGAVGWGAVGLSLRPMFALVLVGFAQDVAFTAPLGVFPLINLGVYALSAAVSDTYDIDTDPIMNWLAPLALFAIGFVALWVLASSVADHAVQMAPLALSFFSTAGVYFAVSGLFRLGRRPGETAGSAV
ncbi:MAG: hypothetical protein AAFQ21_05785 [Pseudomonadota bacterium]